MKGGYVAKVRVMPADVMTCIDLVKKAGIHTQGMSLSQCISLALKGLCQGARNTNNVPTRSGFEYNEMTFPFISQTTQRRKLEVAREAEKDMNLRQAFDNPPPGEQLGKMVFDEATFKRKEIRRDELRAKRDADPINWSDEEQAELTKLADETIIGYT